MPDTDIGNKYWREYGRIAADEMNLRKQVDTYGLALMMIREGAEDPRKVARETLAKFNNIT